MITKKIIGDLVDTLLFGDLDYMAHGCNCFNVMGSGIALTVREEIPRAYMADQCTKAGDKDKLGKYTFGTFTSDDGTLKTCINLYTQYRYDGRKTGKVDLDYDALRMAFRSLNGVMQGRTMGIPLIGCGLAGGTWEKVEEIINEETPDFEIILFTLPLKFV